MAEEMAFKLLSVSPLNSEPCELFALSCTWLQGVVLEFAVWPAECHCVDLPELPPPLKL
jgi:hypothetical protein